MSRRARIRRAALSAVRSAPIAAPIIAAVAAISLLATGCGGGGGPRTPTARGATSPAVTTTATAPAPDATAGALPQGGIRIDEPADGASVRLPFVVAGAANVFEASLQVQVLGPDGASLCQRTVTASAGSGVTGTWQVTMAFVPPAADEEITVRAFDYSARDGTEQDVTTRRLRLSGDEPAVVITGPACNATLAPGAALTVTGTARLQSGEKLTVELGSATSSGLLKKQDVDVQPGVDPRPWSATIEAAGLDAGDYEVVAYTTRAGTPSPGNVFAVPVSVGP